MLGQVARDVNGTTIANFNGHEIDFGKFERLSMRHAIIKYWPENAGEKPEMGDFSSAEQIAAMGHPYNAANPHIPYDPAPPNRKAIGEDFEFGAEAPLDQPTF